MESAGHARALHVGGPITAVAEYEQILGIRPGTFCAYNMAVDGVLDLRQPDMRAACGIRAAERSVPWKSILLVEGRRPPGWDIAARLIADGAAGIPVPSTRLARGTNLVLWR